MSKKGPIDITVSWNGSSWTFSGADDAKGNLTVSPPGWWEPWKKSRTVDIVFKKASGQNWGFVTPYILFGEYGPPKNRAYIAGVLEPKPNGSNANEVAIVDTNGQGSGTAAFYAYSLHVQRSGQPIEILDPMIVNDGGP